MGSHPIISVPQSPLARFTASTISHEFILHAATIPLMSFPHLQSWEGPPTIRCHNISKGFSVLLDLAQSQLQPPALQVCYSSPPDLFPQTTMRSFHLHICLFLPICPASYFSSEADLKCPLFYGCDPPPTTYPRRYVLIPVSKLCTRPSNTELLALELLPIDLCVRLSPLMDYIILLYPRAYQNQNATGGGPLGKELK